MSYSVDEVTAKAKYFKIQGDKESDSGNFQKAQIYYRQSYQFLNLYYCKLDMRKSGIYRRLALSYLLTKDYPYDENFPSIEEACLFAKLYIKIMNSLNKSPKKLEKIYFILAIYYKAREKHQKAIQNFENSKILFLNISSINYKDFISIYYNIASSYEGIYNNMKAIENYENCLKVMETFLYFDDSLLLNIYNGLGRMYYRIDISKSIGFLLKSKDLIENSKSLNQVQLATTYVNLGTFYSLTKENKKALVFFKKSLKIKENLTNADQYFCVELYINMASNYKNLNKRKKALEMYEKARIVMENSHPPNPNLYLLYNNLGNFYKEASDKKKALFYLEESKNLLELKPNPNPETLATVYKNLAELYIEINDKKKALEYYEKSKEIIENVSYHKTTDLAELYLSLGLLYKDFNFYIKAFRLFEKCKDILENVIKSVFYDPFSNYANLGRVYFELNKPNEAMKYYENLKNFFENSKDINFFKLVNFYNLLASLYYSKNMLDKALEIYKKSKRIIKKNFGPNHSDLAKAYYGLSMVFFKMKNTKKSWIVCEKSKNIYEEILDPHHPSRCAVYSSLGFLCNEMQNYKKSLENYKKCLEIMKNIYYREHVEYAGIYQNLGNLYQNMNKGFKAIKYLEKSIKIAEHHFQPYNPILAKIYNDYGINFINKNNSKALEYIEKSRHIFEKSLEPGNIELVKIYNNLSICYEAVHDYKKVFEYCEKSKKILEKEADIYSPELANLYCILGIFYKNINKIDKTLEFFKKCKRIRKRILGPKDLSLSSIYNNLGCTYYILNKMKNALKYFNKSKMIETEHPERCLANFNIWKVYQSLNENKKSSEYFSKYQKIRKKLMNHILMVKGLNSLEFKNRRIHSKGEFKEAITFDRSIFGKYNNYISCIKETRKLELKTNDILKTKKVVSIHSCCKVFPIIYSKLDFIVTNKYDNQPINAHEKECRQFSLSWKSRYQAYKEIKFLKKLSKQSKYFPQIYYYSVMKTSIKSIIYIGMEKASSNLQQYIIQNQYPSERDMKLLFFHIIEAYYVLRKNNIVHGDVSPENILINTPEDVQLCDFGDSFFCDKNLEKDRFPIIFPKKWATVVFLSPELTTWINLSLALPWLKYDPYKSDIFSMGLSLLSACKIDIKGLNEYGLFRDVHIKEMLTINYNYIAGDSLRKVSYKILRENLQKNIDEKLSEFPYGSLREILRGMLEVDMIERSDIERTYKEIMYLMGLSK